MSTLVISYMATGSLRLATLIGSSEAIAKVLLYWGHERVWYRISWGRTRRQNEQALAPAPTLGVADATRES